MKTKNIYVCFTKKIEINKVLNSNKLNYWTGNYCKTFETTLKIFSRKHALTLNSGSIRYCIKSLT